MLGRFDKVTIAVPIAIMCVAQSLWLTTPQPAVSQSTTGTLRRLKPILDTSQTSTPNTPTPPSSSSYSSASPSSSSYSSNPYSQYSPSTSSTTYGTANSSKSEKVEKLMSQALQAHAGGNSSTAESLFRKVLSLDPKNIDAYYNLGVIAEERGDYKEAMQDYQNGIQLDPSDQDLKTAYNSANQKLQQLTNAKQLAAAQAQEQTKLAQQTDQLKFLGAQAASEYHAAKYDAAIKDLQAISAQRPNDPDVQYALAQAYRQKKDYRDAADHINRAIAIVPSNPQYRQLLSTILSERNGTSASSSSSGLAQGIPPAAPSYNGHGDYNDYYSGNSPSGNSANSNSGLYDQSSTPKGGIVPFTPDATEAPPGSTAYQNGNYNNGYSNSGSSYSSSRVKRMLLGGLIGAGAGGLVGSMFHPRYYGYGYGGGSYMMTGALWGGMAGLIFGGVR